MKPSRSVWQAAKQGVVAGALVARGVRVGLGPRASLVLAFTLFHCVCVARVESRLPACLPAFCGLFGAAWLWQADWP